MKTSKKGQLKIFFSYSESIGKTSAMLKSALTAKDLGVDVVVGYITPHTSKHNSELLWVMLPNPYYRILLIY